MFDTDTADSEASSDKLIQAFSKELTKILIHKGISQDKVEKVQHGENPYFYLDGNDLELYRHALQETGSNLYTYVEEREWQHIGDLIRLPVFAHLDLCAIFLSSLKASLAPPKAVEEVFLDNPDLLYNIVADINSRFAKDSEEKTYYINSLMYALASDSQTDFLHQVLKSFFDRHPPILSEQVSKMRSIGRFVGNLFKGPKPPAEIEERIDILIALLTQFEAANDQNEIFFEFRMPKIKIKALQGIFLRQLEPNGDGTFGIPIQDLRQQAMDVLGCNNIQKLKEYIQHCPEIREKLRIDLEETGESAQKFQDGG